MQHWNKLTTENAISSLISWLLAASDGIATRTRREFHERSAAPEAAASMVSDHDGRISIPRPMPLHRYYIKDPQEKHRLFHAIEDGARRQKKADGPCAG